MIIEAFGEVKDSMEWLDDVRINSEVTRDVLVKRVKRGMNGEKAITTPVIKGAARGDTKKRVEDRKSKSLHRARMFVLAQKVRVQFERGIAVEELMDRFGLSKSQVNKISQKNEWYNVHWAKYGSNPKNFDKLVKELEEEEDDNN